MSIRDEINHRTADGRLFLLKPAVTGDPVERTMFISQEIQQLVVGPWVDSATERRCGRLVADLEVFIKGQLISVAQNPRKAKTAYMGHLDPPGDEVWDIRSRDPEPGIRILGRFADTDLFVAFLAYVRKPLGEYGSREWRDATEACKAEWRKLFPAHEPHSGAKINDYISANVFLV